MKKILLTNSKIIRILIFLITAIIFIAIFIISKDKIEEKSNSLNRRVTYSQEVYIKENILFENKVLSEI